MTTITAPGIVLGRCNPYGAETGGPRRLLGGLYGPGSARTEDASLPQNVQEGEWACTRRADVRCRMTCEHGHRGQVMELCSWHDDKVWHGEYTAGTVRQVSETVRQHGHYEEIQRRQAGSCPKCLFPPPYDDLAREVMAWQRSLTAYWPGNWRHPDAVRMRRQIDDAGQMMDLAKAQGIIHNCPLTLVPVS